MNVISNAVTTLLYTAGMMILFAIYVTVIHLGADLLGGKLEFTDEYFHALINIAFVGTISVGLIFGLVGNFGRYKELDGNLLSIIVSAIIAAPLIWFVALPNLGVGIDALMNYGHLGWFAGMLFLVFSCSAAAR